jgi:DNA helicase HerA-like ATPase
MPLSDSRLIGVCVGEITTRDVDFVSLGGIQLGDYVQIDYEGFSVIGFVKHVSRVSRTITEYLSPEDISKVKEIVGDKSLFRGKISILGDFNKGMFVPRIPPEPGTPILKASRSVLEKVFGRDDGKKIHIGHLLTREDVNVYIDIDSIVSRHLSILAVTGAGKSNTVSVIIEGLLEKHGTVLVFDMHGEYLSFKKEIDGKSVVNLIDLKLNPRHLSYSEFRQFANVDDSAFIQDRYLRRARKTVLELIETGKLQSSEFWGRLIGELNAYKEDEANRDDRKSIVGVINKVEDMMESFGELFDLLQKPMVDQIVPGKLNVIDLSHVDEKIADIVVSHVLRNTLYRRKAFVRGESGERIEFPIFTIVEEAHILASSSTNTRSKYWISRVAREGRKFGLGLCLVSQRPKSLDPNSLSQTNNMIILRLIEPGDQKHVQQASESLSSDLVQQLASLNVGEALVMGTMIPVPALVKIKKAEAKRGGSDISAVEEWKRIAMSKKDRLKEMREILDLDRMEF